MADTAHVIAVDQGTGSTRAVVVSADGHAKQVATVPLEVNSPRHGWVEQDPNEIFDSVVTVLRTAAEQKGPPVCLGLSNQRESALAWDARTGEPLGPVLGWQDRRTAARAHELRHTVGERIRHLSGLPVDPMFSALKFEWLLDQLDPDRSKSRRGDIRVGTIDTWLVQRLTGTEQAEAGNASRTQLLNVSTVEWDEELLDIFNIPRRALTAEVARSDARTRPCRGVGGGVDGLRITGVVGDSHAALFAHGVRTPGAVKATYGTGSSIMGLSAGDVHGTSGLVETIGWQRESTARAFEGNILCTGATLVWLGKVLEKTPTELAELAQTVDDSGGVNLVPAFAGLGAPWWDVDAAAVIDGFDQGTTQAHLARAAMESIPLQVEDVLARADTVSGTRIDTVLVDGRPCRNDWLMQLQADISGRLVLRPDETGLSAVGAAHMAGLGAGLWSDADVDDLPRSRDAFSPGATYARETRLTSWRLAVGRSRNTAVSTPD